MPISSKFQLMARAGYGARAAVFFLVAGLALFSGIAGGQSDTKSALDALIGQPFGRIWVGLIALGLLGFVAWRLAQSLGNADNQNNDAKGFAIRVALFGSAMAYIGLAWYAIDRTLGLRSQDGSGSEKGLAEWVMSQPFGHYIAGFIGIGFIIGGGVTIAKGVLRVYEKYMTAEARGSKLITIACVYGLTARGVLFAIVGGLFGYAAFTVSPAQAGSIADALNWIRGLLFGTVLYVVVAIGLASFGAYNLIQARYRIVHRPAITHGVQNAARTAASLAGFH